MVNKRFKTYFTEASILKPDYVIGHKFSWNGKGIKEFEDAGYKRNDQFVIVGPTDKATLLGTKDGKFEKYLLAPDGKTWLFKGGVGYKASSFTHVKESGGTPSGAEWENLIVYAYNESKGSKTDDETKEVADKYWSRYGDISKEIASNFDKNLKATQLVQTGRGLGNVKLGKFWKETGASNKTPKTDIASANFNEKISLKKGGGSQLASAEKKEALAIVNAALHEAGSDPKFAKKITDAIESSMTKLLTNDNVGKLQTRASSGDTSPEIIDYQKKDKDHKELSAMLQAAIHNKEGTDNLFARHIVLEAATGNNKFGSSSSPAAANILGKFDIKTYQVDVAEIKDINSPIIIEYAKKVRPYVSFKKSSAGSPAYSAMRLGMSENFSTLNDIMVEELGKVGSSLLTEDFFTEAPRDMLKRAGTFAKNAGRLALNRFKNAIKKITERIKKTLAKIAKAGKKMFSNLLNFLGIEIKSATGIVGEVSL
jgi:hypothetical protein